LFLFLAFVRLSVKQKHQPEATNAFLWILLNTRSPFLRSGNGTNLSGKEARNWETSFW